MTDEFDRMDRMMSSFGMPNMMAPSIGFDHHNNHDNHERRSRRQEITPFGGGVFGGGMLGGNMFREMDTMMSQMHNNPQGQFFSSSKVISYSSDGRGQPKYYEASSETTQGPNGVRQTKRSERNSETGVDKMAIGHHIYDRGHVVERMRNNRTKEREEKQDFINMDEDERDRFHEEWNSKARSHRQGRALHDDYRYHRNQPRALESADYHRNNLERSRASHNHRHDRDNDRDSRHVRINSRPEEI